MLAVATDKNSLDVQRHLGLVTILAKKYEAIARTRGLERDDLIVEGLLAVHEAIRNYNPARGTTIAGYVWMRVNWWFMHLLSNQKTQKREQWRQWPRDEERQDVDVAGIPGPDQVENVEEAKHWLAFLPARYRRIVKMHFGLGCRPMALADIADQLGCTRQNAQQLVAAALRKMRAAAGQPEPVRRKRGRRRVSRVVCRPLAIS